MADELQQAFSQVFLDPMIWLIVVGAAIYGIFLGAIPGLTATMGVAIFVPITYWMEPVPALAAIVTMVACAIFAGDIPTTLMRVPVHLHQPLTPMTPMRWQSVDRLS